LTGIFFQVEAFLLTMILGVLTGFILQYYQLLIRIAGIKKYGLYMLDIIFWIFMIVMVFMGMLYINQGEMRSYVLIALIIGAIIYYQLMSRILRAFIAKLADSTVAMAKFFVKWIYYFPRDMLYRIKNMLIIPQKKDDHNDEDK